MFVYGIRVQNLFEVLSKTLKLEYLTDAKFSSSNATSQASCVLFTLLAFSEELDLSYS